MNVITRIRQHGTGQRTQQPPRLNSDKEQQVQSAGCGGMKDEFKGVKKKQEVTNLGVSVCVCVSVSSLYIYIYPCSHPHTRVERRENVGVDGRKQLIGGTTETRGR